MGNDDYADVAQDSVSVTIAPKSVTVAPKSFTITQGDAIPTFELAYTGLVGADTLTPSPAPAFTCYETGGTTPVSTSTAAGAYTITWTNEGGTTFTSTNYTVTKTATGTLTINARSSSSSSSSGGGDGSSTSSPNKINTEVSKNTNGSVSLSKTSAPKGEKVTITVSPDRYYKVKDVVITDKSGKVVPVKDNGDGTFTFEMPATDVNVTPTFAWDNPFADVAEDTYYAPAVEWALKNDVTNGTGDGTTFSPGTGCTRGQIMTFLYRWLVK